MVPIDVIAHFEVNSVPVNCALQSSENDRYRLNQLGESNLVPQALSQWAKERGYGTGACTCTLNVPQALFRRARSLVTRL